ncbi:MAG: pyridoxamine 5'-phosphate oxidase family protein [Aeriscardovia sp.]|nr:pyridoxamine 5'-phosphate oxidase family protein [Aeriscardovia sp.]MBP5785702.1 pyridoxamine 5'-phosphate oxidase family protein [Aeriscardovia sp.]MBQ1301534.1 pyridoxamine 5'-phosphate oxidase family protein [Aeriscardovia sp.]MBQ1357304.1 pyridoxamine 5'-phosphate oxidase family protein [Aeriscardovia sp.]MBQ1425216.1 pyridoxamine 5'-phosphate oxidase family protein [Aeriscardovia sp.]
MKLTEEMKDFVDHNLCFVATESDEGKLDLGPKMSMRVLDDSHLMYFERTAGQTYRNLEANGKICIASANLAEKKGFRFYGRVTLYRDGKIFDDAVAFAEKHGTKKPTVVPVIEVTEIQYLDPARAGKNYEG